MQQTIFFLILLTLAACKPSSDSVLLSGDASSPTNMLFTIERNTTIEITAPSGSRMVDLERIQLAKEVTAKAATTPTQKLRYVPLPAPQPLAYRFQAKVTGGKTCRNGAAGSPLNGSVVVQCTDASAQIKQLREACLTLEKEDATLATYPGETEYCTCKKQTGGKILYQDFLGYPSLFTQACRAGAANHQGLCKIITDKFCPAGKECFAGAATCQCDTARLSYGDERYKDNLPRFRDDCLGALGVGASVTNQAPEKLCKDLVENYECPDGMACGYAAPSCQCGDVKLALDNLGTADTSTFTERCEEGLKAAHREALMETCEAMLPEGTASAVDRESCTCINETLYFKDYIGSAGSVDQLKYDCFGD